MTSFVLAACGGATSTAPPPPAVPADCGGELAAIEGRPGGPTGSEVPLAPVTVIAIRGTRTVPERLVRDAIELPTGEPVDPEVVRADIRRILELRAFEDVRIHAEEDGGGLVVVYEVVERRLVSEARLVGSRDPLVARRVERLTGEVFVPRRLHRLAQKITVDRRRDGYAEASAHVRGSTTAAGSVNVCVVLDEGRRWLIDHFELAGNERIEDAELLEQMATYDGRVNAEGGVYREDLFVDDFQRMLALYFDRGMVEARIGEPEARWEGDALHVRLPIEEGAVYRVGRVRVTGALAGPESDYLAVLALRSGAIFSRSEIAAGMARLRDREASRGDIDTIPVTAIDTERRVIDLEVQLIDHSAPSSAPSPAPVPSGSFEVQLTDRELEPPAEDLAP